jgi:hypothetical protein
VTTLPDRSVNRAVGLPTRNKGVPADVAPTTGKPDDAALAKLTKKQQRFITEYLVDYNATRAEIGRSGRGNTCREWRPYRTPPNNPPAHRAALFAREPAQRSLRGIRRSPSVSVSCPSATANPCQTMRPTEPQKLNVGG